MDFIKFEDQKHYDEMMKVIVANA